MSTDSRGVGWKTVMSDITTGQDLAVLCYVLSGSSNPLGVNMLLQLCNSIFPSLSEH